MKIIVLGLLICSLVPAAMAQETGPTGFVRTWPRPANSFWNTGMLVSDGTPFCGIGTPGGPEAGATILKHKDQIAILVFKPSLHPPEDGGHIAVYLDGFQILSAAIQKTSITRSNSGQLLAGASTLLTNDDWQRIKGAIQTGGTIVLETNFLTFETKGNAAEALLQFNECEHEIELLK